ncbi:MAG TPA: hypothetical protein VHD14_16385 [Pseudolabrys sp.]|jgi:hypothetical protein|nr:hypothetical protein [Pseudolabrys sp.]
MRLRFGHALVVAFLSVFDACLLVGCTAAGVGDQLSPEMGGLPTGTPARPDVQYQYPAVHDMPPPRPVPALTDEQQGRLQDELNRLRDRQEGLNAQASKSAAKPAAKPKPAAKKKPSGPNVTGQTGGAKTNP